MALSIFKRKLRKPRSIFSVDLLLTQVVVPLSQVPERHEGQEEDPDDQGEFSRPFSLHSLLLTSARAELRRD